MRAVYEHRTAPLLPRRLFIRRVLRHGAVTAAVLAGSLLVGLLGYRYVAGFGWVDAFLESAMILGGMGPVNTLPNDAAKLFAGSYALYSGVVFLAAMSIVIAPIAHRLLHRLHLEKK